MRKIAFYQIRIEVMIYTSCAKFRRRQMTINDIITILSLIIAFFAWFTKFRWSKEYRIAKDEIIKSKDAIIDELRERVNFYKEMTPMKLTEYFNSIKSALENYNDELQEELKVTKNKIDEKEKSVLQIMNTDKIKEETIKQIEKEKSVLLEETRRLENGINEIIERIIKNSDNIEFLDGFKKNLYSENIKVFDDKGNMKIMQPSSTALDFAYELGSEIGDHARGVRLNRRYLVPLSYVLKSGDYVELFKSNEIMVKESWLEFANNPKSRELIQKTLHNKVYKK